MADINYQNTDEKENSYEALPGGDYIVVITDSETKPNKKGTGEYLNLVYQVVDGPLKGSRAFEKLNLWHDNPQTVQIARGAMNAITEAVGVLNPKDSVLLHNIPLGITVTVVDSEEYGKQNKFKKHYALNEKSAPAHTKTTSTSSAPSSRNAKPSEAAQPWKRP